MTIADDAPQESMAAVRKAEARIKARQWLIERQNPDSYGAKQTLNVNTRGIIAHVNLPAGTNQDYTAILAVLDGSKSG